MSKKQPAKSPPKKVSPKSRCQPPGRGRRGVALREVVVVALMAGLLLLMVVLWLARSKDRSRRDLCAFRQQQTAAALIRWEGLHGHFPGYRNLQAVDANGARQSTGWAFVVLPWLGVDLKTWLADNEPEANRPIEGPFAHVFEEYGPEGAAATRGERPTARILQLICPADRPADDAINPLSWVVNSGQPDAAATADIPADWTANGVFFNNFDEHAAPRPLVSLAYLQAHDGAARTLLLTENVDAGHWTDVEEAEVAFIWMARVERGRPDPGDKLLRINRLVGQGTTAMRTARPASFHPGGVNAVYASGQSEFLSQDIDYLVFTQLMTANGQQAKLAGSERPVPPPYR